jgi:histidyl-tRNA synthetase
MIRIEPRVLKGFRDILPEQELVRRRLSADLEKGFRSFGYVPIDTPILEYTEVLLGKGGGETDKQIFRFTDHGKRDVAMRFDLTVPFARYMAAHQNELYLPFRRYHIGKAYRGENTQRGRFREFVQCDFDIVGTDTASADTDILLTVSRAFEILGVPDITVHVAHRGLFNRFLARINAAEQSEDILRTVDKLRKVGPEQTERSLAELLDADRAGKVMAYVTATGTFEQVLARLEDLAGGPGEDTVRMRAVFAALSEAGAAGTLRYDPSITRGLDYYTGMVFETFLNDLPSIGSVCSGGRYNDLASLYTRQDLPGVGGSIGLDRLLAALDEIGATSSSESAADVLIFCLDEELTGYYHKLATELRREELSCEVYPEPRKISAQFSFAEKKGIPVALICGADERDSGVINGKNLLNRESFTADTPGSAAEAIRTMIRSS